MNKLHFIIILMLFFLSISFTFFVLLSLCLRVKRKDKNGKAVIRPEKLIEKPSGRQTIPISFTKICKDPCAKKPSEYPETSNWESVASVIEKEKNPNLTESFIDTTKKKSNINASDNTETSQNHTILNEEFMNQMLIVQRIYDSITNNPNNNDFTKFNGLDDPTVDALRRYCSINKDYRLMQAYFFSLSEEKKISHLNKLEDLLVSARSVEASLMEKKNNSNFAESVVNIPRKENSIGVTNGSFLDTNHRLTSNPKVCVVFPTPRRAPSAEASLINKEDNTGFAEAAVDMPNKENGMYRSDGYSPNFSTFLDNHNNVLVISQTSHESAREVASSLAKEEDSFGIAESASPMPATAMSWKRSDTDMNNKTLSNTTNLTDDEKLALLAESRTIGFGDSYPHEQTCGTQALPDLVLSAMSSLSTTLVNKELADLNNNVPQDIGVFDSNNGCRMEYGITINPKDGRPYGQSRGTMADVVTSTMLNPDPTPNNGIEATSKGLVDINNNVIQDTGVSNFNNGNHMEHGGSTGSTWSLQVHGGLESEEAGVSRRRRGPGM